MKRARGSLAFAVALVAAGCGGATSKQAATEPVVKVVPIDVKSGPTKPEAIVVLGRSRIDGAESGAAAGADAPEARAAMQDAIARLEAFLVAHPDHPQLTPDAMLRLGALRLDLADLAIEDGDETASARATGEAVAVLSSLVARFPAYARRDDAFYLLGYAQAQAGDTTGAIASYEAVAAITASPRAIEARFRAGELYFDTRELERAIAAYTAVAQSGDDRFRALAQYKLAWSHYRRDDYPRASEAFRALLLAGEHDATAATLVPEAEQYLAICLVELDWDGDGAADPPPRGTKGTIALARIAALLGDGAFAPYRATAERAADALLDEARYAEAAAAYRLVLAVTTEPADRARLEARLAEVAARTR